MAFKQKGRIKDYLRYKTITSQNVPSIAQIKNFFVSLKSYVPFSRSSSFCTFNHFKIYQTCEAMMSISPIYFLNHNSLTHQTWSSDRYKQGQYFFWNLLSNLEDWGWVTNPSQLATCSGYSITNYFKFPVFHFFQKVNKGELKW